MNRSDTEHKSASRVIDSNGANTRLTGAFLFIARTVWLVIVVPSVALFFVGLAASYQQIQRACVDFIACNNVPGALTAKELQTLTSSGFSLSAYAALFTMFWVMIAAIWCGVGFLIFWRRSDDWLALLAAFFLVMFGLTASANTFYALARAYPVLTLPLNFVSFLGLVSIALFFLLFPNGRFVPRWMVLILLLVIINEFLSFFPSITSPFNENWPIWLVYLLAYVVPLVALMYSQIYRYRRVSTSVQRQQTKWIVLGASVAVGFFLGVFAISIFFPNSVNSNDLGGQTFGNTSYPLALLPIPLSIGFSILRYRLYDIDLLINRTLVYGTLTVLLALVYFGLIFALQYVLGGMISRNNDVAIVVSTLAIAALFQPLRHRIQVIIDRRFYRRKYDAAKIVEAFSATLRNEVDLTQLREHLISVVQDTMQPAHVSLWLRPSEHDGTHRAPWRATPPVDSHEG